MGNSAPNPHECLLRATQAYQVLHNQPYRWQCHGLLTIPGRQLPKQLHPCQSLEWVWPTCLLPPGSARTGYPFQLPVVHSCQSNKGSVLQGVVQSTEPGHSTSIITLAASRRDDQKIKPIPLGHGHAAKGIGDSELKEEQSVRGISIPSPSSWQAPRNRQARQTELAAGIYGETVRAPGLPMFRCSRTARPTHAPAVSGGEILLRSVTLCWRMAVVVA